MARRELNWCFKQFDIGNYFNLVQQMFSVHKKGKTKLTKPLNIKSCLLELVTEQVKNISFESSQKKSFV